MSESDTWTDRRERRVFAARVTEGVFSSGSLSLEVLLRTQDVEFLLLVGKRCGR